MNALHQAQDAYRNHAQPIRTPRGTEYQVFARITHRLKQAADRGTADWAELVAAIHDNRRLWTILAMDVADADNGLPQDLRARILYLAEFTRLHSSKVLQKNATAAALIDVNTSVMSGLRDRGARP